MYDNDCVYERPKDETHAAQHWLYANMPEGHDALKAEALRLQRTIAALIAIGATTQNRAYQAYEIAGAQKWAAKMLGL